METLEQYQLNQSILNQEDYVLELWYGKPGLYFINELRKINKIERSNSFKTNINYYINDNWLLQYNSKTEIFWINYIEIWSVLESKYQLNYKQIRDLTKSILEQVTNCKVNTTKRLDNGITP